MRVIRPGLTVRDARAANAWLTVPGARAATAWRTARAVHALPAHRRIAPAARALRASKRASCLCMMGNAPAPLVTAVQYPNG